MPALPNGLHRARLSRVGQTPAQIYTIGAGLTLDGAGVLTNDLLTGKAGGQTATGGTGAGENLTLQSTTDAVKGNVYLGAALTVFVNGVAGNPRFNVDGTGLATTVPALVKNGKSESGVELWYTGTVATGYDLMNASGVLKGGVAIAAATNDWITTSAADDIVLHVGAGKKILLGLKGAALPTMSITPNNLVTVHGTGAFLAFTGGSGAPGVGTTDGRVFGFYANNAEVARCSADGVNLLINSGKKLQIDSANSLTAVALQVSGDPNTGVGQVGGADTLSMVAGGAEILRAAATQVKIGNVAPVAGYILDMCDTISPFFRWGSSAVVGIGGRTSSGPTIGPYLGSLSAHGFTLQVNAADQLRLNLNAVVSASGAVWDAHDHLALTCTLSGSNNVTTVTGLNFATFRAPTISAASALSVALASTVYIAGPPVGAGAGPATLTKSYPLWVDAGLPRLDSTTPNGAVATVLGSVGPVGASTTVQEWLTIDINGTTRYIPCF